MLVGMLTGVVGSFSNLALPGNFVILYSSSHPRAPHGCFVALNQ